MIEHAQVLYAEILQLSELATKHRTSYEFWKLMHEALKDEQMLFVHDKRGYRRKDRDIRGRLKRNKKQYEKYKKRIETLKYKYKRLARGRNDDSE